MANNVRESLIGLPLGSSSSENDESDPTWSLRKGIECFYWS